MNPRRTLVAWALGASTLLAPALAGATLEPQAERDMARELADEAANAYARQEYEQAVQLLQRAYRLVQAPTIALLEARALLRLGRMLGAQEAYQRVLAASLALDAPPAFRRAVQEARAELAMLSPRIPQLEIVVLARDSQLTVLLDGRVLAAQALGVSLPLDPGLHTVTSKHEDGRMRSQRILLQEGTRHRALVEGFAPTTARDFRFAGVALALGGVGVSAGIIAGLVAVGAHGDAVQGCPNRECQAGSPGARALNRFYTYRAVSTVSYLVGASALGVGAYVLLTDGGSSRSGVALIPTANGFSLRGTL